MNLIDDHMPDLRQMFPETFADKKRLQGLGRGDQEIRGGCSACFLRSYCEVSPVTDADAQPQFMTPPLQAQQNVPVQGSQGGRDIHGLKPAPLQPEQLVEHREHGTLGLSGARRGGDEQEIFSFGDRGGYGLLLGQREFRKIPFPKCRLYCRRQQITCGHR